jgi:uncharacterized protein (TIGR02145 family)
MKYASILLLFCFSIANGQTTSNSGNQTNTSIKVVTIGSQTWTSENLRTTTFNNGDPIYRVKSGEFSYVKENDIPAYYVSDDGQYFFYNYAAITDVRGLAPNNFRIPSNSDWIKLLKYVGDGDFQNNCQDEIMALRSRETWPSVHYPGSSTSRTACENCKNWNNEYRSKVACHICKDTRYVEKKITPQPYTLSGNGSDKFGFCVKMAPEATVYWSVGDSGNTIQYQDTKHTIWFSNSPKYGKGMVVLLGSDWCLVRCVKDNY